MAFIIGRGRYARETYPERGASGGSGQTGPTGNDGPTGPAGPAGSGMTILRTTQNIIGSESASGVTIATGASLLSAQVDALGNNDSVASLNLYVRFTSTVPPGTGTVDVSIFPVLDNAGPAYDDAAPLVLAVDTKVGTTSVCVNLPASRLPTARFYKVNVLNNGTGADITDVFVGAETTVTS